MLGNRKAFDQSIGRFRLFLTVLVPFLFLASCRRATETVATAPAVPILMYHKVGETTPDKWWVTPGQFAAHLLFLRERGYESVLPCDMADFIEHGKPLPPKPVVITFDDGYLNVVEQAEPILRKYGFRAVVYLPTGLIGGTPADRRELEGTPCLIWPEVVAAQQRGTLHFGAHGHAHRDLRRLKDAQADILKSAETMAEQLGRAPDSFCYPFGRYRPEHIAMVRDAGFRTAMTCRQGAAILNPGTVRLELPRLHVVGGANANQWQTLLP